MQQTLDKIDIHETIINVSQRLKFGMMLMSLDRTEDGWDMIVDSIKKLDALIEYNKQKSN